MTHLANKFYLFYFHVEEEKELWSCYILLFVLLCINVGFVWVQIFLIRKYKECCYNLYTANFIIDTCATLNT